MKRDAKQALLAQPTQELRQQLPKTAAELVQAMQERHLQNRAGVDTKRAYKLRKQLKTIKAELTRRQNEVQE